MRTMDSFNSAFLETDALIANVLSNEKKSSKCELSLLSDKAHLCYDREKFNGAKRTRERSRDV